MDHVTEQEAYEAERQAAQDELALAQAVEMGQQAQRILSTPVMQRVASLASESQTDAMLALVDADPNDPGSIMKLQVQARADALCIRRLAQLINEAEAAEMMLAQQQQQGAYDG